VTSCKLKTYSKINLSLRVFKPRKDGYHPLCSVFQAISLYDEITIEHEPDSELKFILTTTDSSIPIDEKNVITKVFLKLKSQLYGTLRVHLIKNLPHGAGLGGGSSNAAGFIAALNQIFNLNFSENQARKIAVSIGADVAFFLGGSPALIRGIGDRITPLKQSRFTEFVLINPWIFSSTKTVYGAFDQTPSAQMSPIKTPKALLIDHIGTNDLKPVVFDLFPKMNEIEAQINQVTGSDVYMSGSGSTLFLAFEESQAADIAHKQLKAHFAEFWIKRATARETGYDSLFY